MIDQTKFDYAYNYTHGHSGHPDEGSCDTYYDDRDDCMHYRYTILDPDGDNYYHLDVNIVLLHGPPMKHIVTRWFEHSCVVNGCPRVPAEYNI